MIRIQSASSPGNSPSTIGMAVAGGGPLGGIFELGVLRALEECLDGVDFTDLHAYVGVSSGAFIAASLANQLSPRQMCRIFINSDKREQPFKPDFFLQPAFREYGSRLARIPGLLMKSVAGAIRHPLSWSEQFARIGQLVPSGVFDNNKIERFLSSVYELPGRTNDFRELKNKLYIVGVDLDTGASVRFGSEKFDHVPISRAVQASAALPGLYPPVEIDGRFYVDGALRRTLHASAALDEGVDLLIGLNPLVPYDGTRENFSSGDSLVQGGLPRVLSQTFRALIQSRMQIGLEKYANKYQKADLLIIEPDRNDTRMFFTNVFSYSSRKELCEHAYQRTRADLAARRDELGPLLLKHGVVLNDAALDDQNRHFDSNLEADRTSNAVARQLHRTLDELQSNMGFAAP